MSIVFFSSFLLAVPAYVAAKNPKVHDVAISSAICTLTSLLTHGWRNVYIFHVLDKLVVRVIGLYYCCKAASKLENVYHALTIWWGLLAVYLYATRPNYEFQPLVHLISMIGMLTYIKAETQTTLTK